jgi:hypothetical protein
MIVVAIIQGISIDATHGVYDTELMDDTTRAQVEAHVTQDVGGDEFLEFGELEVMSLVEGGIEFVPGMTIDGLLNISVD